MVVRPRNGGVSVGYFVSGIPGAIAGWLAMITPALLIIPLVHFAGRHIERPRVKGALQAVVIASADLLLAASIPLAQAALTDWVTIAIANVSLVLLLTTELDTLWIILGAALISLSASSLGLIGVLQKSYFLRLSNVSAVVEISLTPSQHFYIR